MASRYNMILISLISKKDCQSNGYSGLGCIHKMIPRLGRVSLGKTDAFNRIMSYDSVSEITRFEMNYTSRNDDKTIHVNGTNFIRIPFQNEEKLERLAVEHKDILYGRDALYFDIKRAITSITKNSGIPDGYLLTATNPQDAKFWVVEYELSGHSLYDHIIGQLGRFLRAISNETSKRRIRDAIFDEINANPDYRKKIEKIMTPPHNEIRYFLEQILERNCGLIVVIDEKSPDLLDEVSDIAGPKHIENHVLEFVRFENEAGQEAFLLDTLFNESKNFKRNAKGHFQSEDAVIADKNILQLHEQVEKEILALGNDVVRKPTNGYLGLWRNNRLFASIHKRRSFLRIGISIKPYELHDPNKVAKDRGRGSDIDLSQQSEIDYAMMLVKQAYDKG